MTVYLQRHIYQYILQLVRSWNMSQSLIGMYLYFIYNSDTCGIRPDHDITCHGIKCIYTRYYIILIFSEQSFSVMYIKYN